MTAAPHSGMLRFTFPQNKQSRIQIDLGAQGGRYLNFAIRKSGKCNTIEGWMKCTPDGGGWGNGDGHADYTVYFHAEFSKPLKDYGVWSANIPNDWERKREEVESDKYQEVVAKAEILRKSKKSKGNTWVFIPILPPKPTSRY
jgi:putative alpha-1,2-mannosidase